MEVKEILSKLDTVCDMYENDAIDYLYTYFLNESEEGLTTKEKHKKLIKYGCSSEVGYDCGWVRVEFFNTEFQTQLDELVKSDEAFSDYKNISSTKFFFLSYTKNCIELGLPNYPLNIQSTSIKSELNDFLMKKAKNAAIGFDGIDFRIGITLD